MHGKSLGLFAMFASALGLSSDRNHVAGPGINGKKMRSEPYTRVLDKYGNPARNKKGKICGKPIGKRRSYILLPKHGRT